MERDRRAGRAARGSPVNAALRGLLLSIRDRILLPAGRRVAPNPPALLRSPARSDPPPGRRCPPGSRTSVRFSAVPLSFRSEPRATVVCFNVLLPEPAPFPSDPPL